MHDVRIALDLHEGGQPHGAELGNAPYVVSAEVDEHEMLGAFLRIGRELGSQYGVLLRRGAPGAGSRDRPESHLAVLHPNEDLGRAPDDMNVVTMQIVQVRCRIQGAQVSVSQERVRRGDLDPAGKNSLKGVSRGDVFLDATHVILEAAVGVRCRGGRKGRPILDGERLGVPGGRQASQPIVDRRFRGAMKPAELVLLRAGRHLDIRDDGRAIVQVVEHEQRVGHHQHRVGQLPIVRRRIGKGLDGSHDVVPQVTHRPTGESRETGNTDRRMLSEKAAEVIEGRDVAFGDAPAGAGGPSRALPVPIPVHLARIGGEEGVSRPPFASLEGLEKETVRPPMQLGEGRHWSVAVEHDLPGDGDHAPAGTRALSEGGEPQSHWAAATR